MKKAGLVVVLLIIFTAAYATIDEFYSFTASTGTYVPITGTAIGDVTGDDMLSSEIQLGFDFPYGDEVYSSYKLSSNGWIGLGGTAPHSNLSNMLEGPSTFPYIAPLWDDTSLASGAAAYELSGTAPNRVYTIQYNNLRWNYGADNQFNMQIKLYENGQISFHYGPSTGTPSNASASIGIVMSPGGTGWFISVTPGTPANHSTQAANNGITAFPGDGVIYQFVPVPPADNDLVGVSIAGNTTPSMNAPSVYNIQIRNRGALAQTAYTVKLMSSTGQMLASMPGNPIAAGEVQTYPVAWTPTVQGPITILGEVDLPGDENPINDQTPPMSISVMPEGLNVVTIGDGTELGLIPVDMYYRNSLYESLYYPTEINFLGTITALAFYNNFTTNLPAMPTKVWLGTTTQADLSGGWIPSTQLTQVFDGTIDYPSGQNTILIPLQTVFTYTGGNLVLLMQRPMDTQYYNYNDRFLCQTVGTNRALRASSDGTIFDPASPPIGTQATGQFPKTSFYITPLSDEPLFMCNPDPVEYGTVLINTEHSKTVRMVNAGGGTLTINSVSLSGDGAFTMSGLPALPQSLATGQIVSFELEFAPLTAGDYTAQITAIDDVTRQTHVIEISGTAMDPTIYELPHAEDFAEAPLPFLPLAWSSISPAANPNARVYTQNSTVFSTPNAVCLYNENATADDIILVAPPLGPAINVTDLRIKFYTRSGSGSYDMQVGMLTDPANPATFVLLETVSCSSVWEQQVVSLAPYTGAGRYVAFRHGNQSSWVNLYLDDYMIEESPTDDLAPLSVAGNTTPSVGSQSIYTVLVKNWGSSSQSVYEVKLYDQTNTEVGSSPGVTVAGGATVQVQVGYTPTVEGPGYIYAKTILAGDQNPLNDQSPNYNISVQPAGVLSVTVGDGSMQGRYPIDMFWRNSVFETLYYQAEMGMLGTINTLVFYNNFQTNLLNMPTKIWLGTTQQNDLSAGWINANELTLVYDGTVNYPSGQNTIVIDLDTPFTYTGGNLVLLANRPLDTQYYSSADNFYTQSVGTNRSRNSQSDSTVFDPFNLPDGAALTGNFPKTTFMMSSLSDDPLFIVNPDSLAYGLVLQDTQHTRTMSAVNAGGAPLTLNSIQYGGSEFFTVQGLPNLPLTLNTGQGFQFTVTYSPTSAGQHTGSITFVDDQPEPERSSSRRQSNRLTQVVSLSGNAIDPTITELPYLQGFDTVTVPNLPVTWSKLVVNWNSGTIVSTNQQSQTPPNSIQIYTQEEDAGNLYLIGPPLDEDIPITGMRTKFYARGQAGYSLVVGIMSNSQDASTFVPVQTVDLSNNWAQYVVAFTNYTGEGRYIAFKHGGGTWRSIYVDDVMLELTPQNDLAPLSITGNTTPSVGSLSNYTVSVFNWGTQAQNTYQVKLFDGNDTELAVVDGVAVAPNQAVNVVLPWTPTAEGATTLYAKTFLATDQNLLNDASPTLNVVVQPQGLVVLTVGEGNEEARLPVDFYWRNSLSETIYSFAELSNTLGIIYGINYHNNFPENLSNMPTKVWMGTTAQTSLENGWIPSTNLQLVFDGTVDYPSGENTIVIPLQTPFMYLDAQNLVVMVNRPMDTQYYSSGSYFKCQTIGTNRTRYQYSDSEEFDPTAPSEGTLTGQFPKTTFMIIPGGVGHIDGLVTDPGDQPLAGVAVHLDDTDYSAVSNAQGVFTIQNIIADNYTLTMTKHGYITHTQAIEILEDETLELDITMNPMPTVNVSGTILASDTGAGINGASIHLTGYEDYTANTNATGAFTVSGVYANNTYNYTVIMPGYSTMTGTMTVGSTNHSMGNLTMAEVAYAPSDVNAALNDLQTEMLISWLAPDPNNLEITESFEFDMFPPVDWTQEITNDGPPNAGGVSPTWSRFGPVTIGTSLVSPTDGEWQAGLWWSYEHQDEWLISPVFTCPDEAHVAFSTYCYYGSAAGDHYYVKASLDGGLTWTVLWDASTQVGGWNYYASPVVIDLSAYAGQQIKLAWHAVDPPSNDGLWYTWFIDQLFIGNAIDTISFDWSDMEQRSHAKHAQTVTSNVVSNSSRAMEQGYQRSEPSLPMPSYHPATNDRFLVGYKVWRLHSGQEANPGAWIELTPEYITSTDFADIDWSDLEDGTYKWAVRSIYTADVSSGAAFSNEMLKETVTGMISGVVRQQNNLPIPGAVITAGEYTATTNNSGAYSIVAETGIYSVTASANGYQSHTVEGVSVLPDQSTTVNFVLIPGSDADDPSAPVTETALVGNYPNPFNPSTAIKYTVLNQAHVTILIYNTRGQLVKTLVNEFKAPGRHEATWDGRDEQGLLVSSGIYHFKMISGAYSSTRKMILLK